MPNEKEWFERLAAIPGSQYKGSPRVNRATLWGYNFRPVIEDYGSEYGPSVMWPNKGGGQTSVSPAGQARTDEWQGPTSEVLQRLEELLELPGFAADYHFAIQGCCEELWKRRRTEPTIFQTLEGLYWLNINLVKAKPNLFTIAADNQEPTFYVMYAFRRLYTLYFREGFVQEAIEVAKLCEEFGQGGEALLQIESIREAEVGADS
jgi:hypothetical protein